MPLLLSAIQEAQNFLSQYLPVTRLVDAPSLSGPTAHHAGANVYLKLENELPTGSFKPRGALYALAVNVMRRPVRQVIAASTGNHGAAVAYAAKELGVPAKIFLPQK